MTDKPLTPKQQRFVDAYDGNATQAARIAGYKNARVSGSLNMTKVDITSAIAAREGKRRKKTIKTREQRQEFWSDTMDDTEQDIQARLRASELLGKSEADFTENINARVGTEDLDKLTPAERLKRLEELRAKQK